MGRHKEVDCIQGSAIASIQEKVEEIHHCIKGNGKPGLAERMTVIETEKKTESKMWDRFFGTGIVFMIVSLVIQGIMLYLYFKGK